MSQIGETAVKVFGWTITSVYHHPLSPSSSSSSSCSIQPHMIKNQTDAHHTEEEENTRLKISSNLNKESKETSENSDDQHSEITTTTTSSQEKTTLKKPDKILPCPRCKSADTKFCYYNNYNVNQPRHFCRNCQRYWTSGGSMRTVPVGSGRRKNKGWVSSDPSNDYTNNYNSSSTKILSFESSESLVTENGSNHRSSDAKTTANSVSHDFNNFQGFLPPQVTSPVSPLWPYQYPPNPSFYHMPVSWVPVWCTQETSTCLGKRTRETPSINNEASLATKNHLWHPIPTKREKTEHFSFFKKGSETKSNNMRFVPQTYLSLQANPAAMERSMSFRESM